MDERDRQGWFSKGAVLGALSAGLLGVLLALTGCIVGDELTTLTVRNDGSAEWSSYRSDLHSTESGRKGAEELSRFLEDFEAARTSEFVRLREAGAEIVDARFVRREEPCACLIRARLPDARSLERFLTTPGEGGRTLVTARFTAEGDRRRLGFSLTLPAGDPVADPAAGSRAEQEADGSSRFRISFEAGKVLEERGFAVAKDGRSVLVDLEEIEAVLREGEGRGELFVEWQAL